MDSDSGRCRRTDGKKWRCRKQVVADNKYCEQHMHRGRQRSRKPVEVTETTSKSDTPITTSSNKTKQMIKSGDAIGTGTKFPIPGNHKFEVQKSPAIVASTTPSSANGKGTSNSNVFVTSMQAAINISHAVDTDNICETNSKYVDGNVLGFNLTDDKKNRNNNVGNNRSGSVTPGFVFTLKSALRNGTSRNNKSSRDHCSVAEVEPKRCRRTDGKKWRCSRDVVPQKKYCDSHMLRGRAKRHKVSSPSITVDEASLVPVPKNDHINLNISIDSRDLTSHEDDDDVSRFTSSSCSDATTVTTDKISTSNLLATSS